MEPTYSPYDPPKSPVDDNNQELVNVIPASKWLRFFNFTIDYVAFLGLGLILGIMVAIFWGEEGVRVLESLPDIAIGVPVILVYYIFFESLTGRTLGKFITGTKVVNENGLKASFGQILGRSFSRLIPFEAFSFFGEEGRGWHDSIPKTYVIKTRGENV